MKDWRFIDIHSHIIPGVDDGSKNMDTSLKLVDLAYQDGIRDIICTPHFGIINPTYDTKKVSQSFDALSMEVKKLYPDMKLYFGNELFLAPGYGDGLDDNMSMPLAGSRYVLVEFSDDVDFNRMFHEIRRILVKGYIPIIAHTERYMGAYRNVKNLMALKEQGVLIQVNSNSICTLEKEQKRFSLRNSGEKLLKEMLLLGLIDFVATDTHDMPGREPRMSKAKEVMIGLIGEEETKRILVDNPMRIIGER